MPQNANITAPTGGDSICTVTIAAPPSSNFAPANFTFTVVARKWQVTGVPASLQLNTLSSVIQVAPVGHNVPAGICAIFNGSALVPQSSNVVCFPDPNTPLPLAFTPTAVGPVSLRVALSSGDAASAWVPTFTPLNVLGGIFILTPTLNENVSINAAGEWVLLAGSDLTISINSSRVAVPLTWTLTLSSNSSTSVFSTPALGTASSTIMSVLTMRDLYTGFTSPSDSLPITGSLNLTSGSAFGYFNAPTTFRVRLIPGAPDAFVFSGVPAVMRVGISASITIAAASGKAQAVCANLTSPQGASFAPNVICFSSSASVTVVLTAPATNQSTFSIVVTPASGPRLGYFFPATATSVAVGYLALVPVGVGSNGIAQPGLDFFQRTSSLFGAVHRCVVWCACRRCCSYRRF